MTPRAKGERLPGLDVLRGLAALAVVLFHFTTRFSMIFGHPAPPPFFVPWGQRGVEVFFVISGFAIQLSLESEPSPREFVVARALRLYPTFWASLAITLAVVWSFGLPERGVSVRDAFLNLTMIPASLGAHAADAVYWTLERELRFYGLVLLLLALGLRRYAMHALLFTVLLQAASAVTDWVPHALRDLGNLGFAHLMASGMLIARARRAPSAWTYVLLALTVLSSRLLGFLPFAYGAGAIVLVWLAGKPFRSVAAVRPLVFLGQISYSLFLVHQYVGYVLMRALYARGASPIAAITAAVATGLVLAVALHFAVEKPSMALLRRVRARRAVT
jgi:peptidoglycan/LPS O-acetylase OafA/YrhL